MINRSVIANSPHIRPWKTIENTSAFDEVMITTYRLNFLGHSAYVADRKCKFLKKFIVSDNMPCQVFKDVAMVELALLASNAY